MGDLPLFEMPPAKSGKPKKPQKPSRKASGKKAKMPPLEQNREESAPLLAPKPPLQAREKPRGEVRYDFSRVVGQEKVKSLLIRTLRSGRVGKAYLFFGPEGSGKVAMALELAKALNCRSEEVRPCQKCSACRQIGKLSYPDFQFVFPAPKNFKEADHIRHVEQFTEDPYRDTAVSSTAVISIDRIRELKHVASLKRHQGGYEIFLITQADRMTPEAANSLLKLLEEPPQRLILILTTSRLERLLPTIISRCQVIQFTPLKAEEIRHALLPLGVSESQADIASRLAMGNFRKAREILDEDFELLRQQAFELLRIARQENEVRRLELVDELVAGRDRGKIKELFQLVLLWLRDAQVYLSAERAPESREYLYNADRLEKIEELVHMLNGINLEKTILETENSIDLVGKNVYINLVLINYLNFLAEKRVA